MDKLPVNIVDLAVFGILLVSGLMALFAGFVRAMLSILGWIAALAATWYFYGYAEPIAKEYIKTPILAYAAAGAGIFLPTLIFCSVITYLVAERVRSSAISAVDRSLGFLYGLARGALIVVLAWWAVDDFILPANTQPPWVMEARTRPLAVAGYTWLKDQIVDQFSGSSRREKRPERPDQPAPRPTPVPSRQPVGGADSAKEPGYKTDERKGIESLIRSQDKQ